MFTVQLTAPGGSRFVTQCAAYKIGPYRHSRKKFSLVCYQKNSANELEADPLIWVGPEKEYLRMEVFGHDWHEVVNMDPNPELASDTQASSHRDLRDALEVSEEKSRPPEQTQKTPVAHV